MDLDTLFHSLAQLDGHLTEHNRPMRLRLGDADTPLLPQRVEVREAMCEGVELQVFCVAPDTRIELKSLLAQPLELQVVTDQGALRSFSGIVTEASAGESDGALATYQLVARDALSILDKRCNTRVFLEKNELDIVQLLFGEWRQRSAVMSASFDWEVDIALAQRELPQRAFTMQHNESDGAFIRRLLKRRGISWFFRAEGQQHTLVLFDDARRLQQCSAGTVRYHRDDATEQRDTITAWCAVRRLQPGSASCFSWDYADPLGTDFMRTRAQATFDQGESGSTLAASLEDYLVEAPRAAADNEDHARLGQLRIARAGFEAKCFHGEGSVRDLFVGQWFRLDGHPDIDTHDGDGRCFIVTNQHFSARNNLPKGLDDRVTRLFARSHWSQNHNATRHPCESGDPISPRTQTRFTCVRRGTEIVPAYDPRTDVPVPPMQSAIVVGPEGEEVHCDEQGRVKVRFPGMRPEDHEHDWGAGASGTDSDSAWVRVATSWAGGGPGQVQQFGTLCLPRVGSEVIVSFMGGDPDKPVIVGQVYNGNAPPPSVSGESGLPGNRYLSGLRSKEVHGSRGNQLRFDDTPGEICAQLGSDQGSSQINLGLLTTEREDGSGEQRGDGAELRSDGAVAVRGGSGVLITANPSDIKDKQLLRTELEELTDALHKLVRDLGKFAQENLHESQDVDGLSDLTDAVKKMDEQAGRIVAISAPDGLLAASGQHAAMEAAGQIDLASGDAMRITSGKSLRLRAEEGVNVLAHKDGLHMASAKGTVALRALDDAMELMAKRVLELISTTDWITIKAKQGVRINGGGSEIEIGSGGIALYAAGGMQLHGSEFRFTPPRSRPVQFEGDIPFHEICVPCLLHAAENHSPLARSK